MAVQVWIGRAGTGKTRLCLDALRERLRADAADGNHLIFLVPEQAAFQMERALIETPGLRGYHRCDVLSFRRLARRVLLEAGAGLPEGRQPLGAAGRLMAVKLLLRRHEPEMQILAGEAVRRPGFLRQLAGLLDEWLQEALDPDLLRDLADARATDPAIDPLAQRRLLDLHKLYTAYRKWLAGGHMDPAREMSIAASLANQIPWLRDAEVWVDGFAGFTALERHMVVRLAKLARSLTVTLLLDPAAPVLQRRDARPDRFSLFARTERTFVTLREAMEAEGIAWHDVRTLPSDAPKRFADDAPELRELERRLFRDPAIVEPAPDVAPPPCAERPSVRIIAAANRRIEVELAAAGILRLLRESGGALRFRDVAVIVRDLEPYHDLLSAALDAQRIPFFIDRRRSTAHHPLVELLRLLPMLVWRSFDREDVRLLLKTGLTPLDDREADALENYVVANGISGAEAWLGAADWRFGRLFTRHDPDAEPGEDEQAELAVTNTRRRRLVEPLRDWFAFASRGVAMGRAWAERIDEVWERLRLRDRIEDWACRAAEDGRADEADVHRQVWTDTQELLEEFARGLGDLEIGIDEVAAVLDAAIGEFTLGLAPPTLDQVLVGSIERSRHPEVAAVFLLGFNDGLFPFAHAEDVLLPDAERERLGEKRPPVGTTRRQRMLDEKMLAYIAMTRAGRRLCISYARADEAGRPLHASPFLGEVRAVLPHVTVEDADDPAVTRAMWPIGRAVDLGAGLAAEFRSRPDTPQEDPSPARARWNVLYDRVRRDRLYEHDLRPVLASLQYRNEPALAPTEAARLFPSPARFSASRIETFAQCPFRHFAMYGLRLEPRVEFVMASVDLGLLHHKVLEEFYAELIAEEQDLAGMAPEEIETRLQRLAVQWSKRLTDESILAEARNQFILNRGSRHLRDAVARQQTLARAGRFRPRAVEWTFGLRGERAVPAVELTTPRKRRILLRGKVDRIDVLELQNEMLGIVLDYKSSKRKLPLWKVYHGLDVQLMTYMLSLVQHGETLAGRAIRPVGAFYVPLSSARESVKHPDDAASEADGIPDTLRPRGLADMTFAGELDRALAEAGKSSVYKIQRNKDGRPSDYAYNDAYDAEDVERILAHAREKIGELADRAIDGEIAVRPSRTNGLLPCRFCDFRSVCRFDYATNRPVDVPKTSRKEILHRLGAPEGEGTA